MTRRSYRGDGMMAEIASMVGAETARKLADAFGGTELYIPAKVGDHHPIAAAIGREAADMLASSLGGQRLDIPKQAARRARVIELRKYSRLTVSQIALQTSFSERHVYRLLSDEADDAQMSIFDYLD